MKRTSRYFTCLFLFTGVLIAQNRVKTMSGEVSCPDADCSGITVLNKRSLQGTITDVSGRFSIQVRQQDTLVFSAVQYKVKQVIVEDYLFNSSFVRIPMEAFVNELDEVVVQPYNLSGNLGSDAAAVEPEAPPSAKSLGLPNAGIRIITQEERKIQEATTGSGLVPLNPILNAITGRTKRLKRNLRLRQTYERTQRVRAFYADSLFVRELKIPAEKIDDFMYYCEIDTVFQAEVDRLDRLRIWEYMKGRAQLYLANAQSPEDPE